MDDKGKCEKVILDVHNGLLNSIRNRLNTLDVSLEEYCISILGKHLILDARGKPPYNRDKPGLAKDVSKLIGELWAGGNCTKEELGWLFNATIEEVVGAISGCSPYLFPRENTCKNCLKKYELRADYEDWQVEFCTKGCYVGYEAERKIIAILHRNRELNKNEYGVNRCPVCARTFIKERPEQKECSLTCTKQAEKMGVSEEIVVFRAKKKRLSPIYSELEKTRQKEAEKKVEEKLKKQKEDRKKRPYVQPIEYITERRGN